ncbi:MAG: 30S ribosome-binding factor RbfA [Pseudomonadota bacterium]
MKRTKKTSDHPAAGRRQLKVGQNIRKILADILTRATGLGHITVTEVRMSPDLRLATVFITPLGRDDLDIVSEVTPHTREISQQLSRRLHLKYMPRLVFRPDASFAQAARISTILQSVRTDTMDTIDRADSISGDSATTDQPPDSQ